MRKTNIKPKNKCDFFFKLLLSRCEGLVDYEVEEKLRTYVTENIIDKLKCENIQ